MDAVHTLLSGAIDYAGLFPPAQLGMVDAVANYATYRQSGDAWALGRFVVPANRLDELERAHAATPDRALGDPWSLSVLAGPHLDEDLARIRALSPSALRTESLEIRADTLEEIEHTGMVVNGSYETYMEISPDENLTKFVEGIHRAGLRAKIRTGGVVAAAFPSSGMIVRFIARCLASGVPFKATAGLHHLRTGAYRLTYDPGSETARMYGFLNLFTAAALLRSGASEAEAERALLETDPGALRLEPESLVWRDRRFDRASLAALRREALIAFGSCSFREPLDELQATGI